MAEDKNIASTETEQQKREFITLTFERALSKVTGEFPEVPEPRKFGGFYNEDSNARASRVNGFNEKYIDIPNEEIARIAEHEAQHERYNLACGFRDNPENMWLFALHPNFREIYSRLSLHYEKYKDQLTKHLAPLPNSYFEFGSSNDNYAHPDELLAMLKGYETFLDQTDQGLNPVAQPYEFIEAFKKDDLKLLDPEYRAILAAEVAKNQPDAIPRTGKPIEVKLEEVS